MLGNSQLDSLFSGLLFIGIENFHHKYIVPNTIKKKMKTTIKNVVGLIYR